MSLNNVNSVDFGNSAHHRGSQTRYANQWCSESKPSTAAKGKNHPNFTIILRRQLPVSLNSNGDCDAVSGSKFAADSEEVVVENTLSKILAASKDSSIRAKAESCAAASLRNKQDFYLNYAWQIWILDDKESAITADWNVKKHGQSVKTARDFWSIYIQIYEVFDKLNLKNLMIFQDAIEPKWEDRSNLGGGRWYFDVSYNGRNEFSRREGLIKQNYWTHCLETVMSGCLGPQSSLIVGLILHFKSSKYRVSLWIRSCSDFNQVIQLGASLRKYLNLRCQLKFELHYTTTCPSSQVTVYPNTVLESELS